MRGCKGRGGSGGEGVSRGEGRGEEGGREGRGVEGEGGKVQCVGVWWEGRRGEADKGRGRGNNTKGIMTDR